MRTVSTDIGHLLLSPTRTYAPLLKRLLTEQFDAHSWADPLQRRWPDQMHEIPARATFRVIKDNLFEPPVIFKLIQQASGSDDREMYQVFNMGHRLEIFTEEAAAGAMIDIAGQLGHWGAGRRPCGSGSGEKPGTSAPGERHNILIINIVKEKLKYPAER